MARRARVLQVLRRERAGQRTAQPDSLVKDVLARADPQLLGGPVGVDEQGVAPAASP